MTTDQQTLPAERPRATVSDDLVWIMDTARFEHMWRIAKAMSDAKLMPEHLRNSPSDCMLVVEQSNRWGMSPFAVASCTYSVGGKLGYEGKLVAGVINARGNLKHRLSYEYEGNPDKIETLACTVSGTIQGEAEPRTVRVTWKQGDGMSKGAKDKWNSQPEQQLAYFGARAWARRHMPELLLGIYTPEELLDAEGDMRDVTPKKSSTAAERRAAMAAVESSEIVDADGEVHYVQPGAVDQFLRDNPGAHRAGEAIEDAPQSPVAPPQVPTREPGTTTPAAPSSPVAAPAASNGNGSRKLRIWLGPLAQIEAPAKEALAELRAAIQAVESIGELNALTEHNGELLRALQGGNREKMTAAIDEARKRLDEPPDDSWQLGDEPTADDKARA